MSDRIRAIHGDSREVLKTLAGDSVDSCVCDPPYALVTIGKRFGGPDARLPNNGSEMENQWNRVARGFMGQKWDTGETAHDPEFWREVYRVLKPGAHVVAFGGTRTFHRLVCAIEDAGFEVRDMISWIFGSGFPKSHSIGNGWGTALKPALEPITLARKPIVGTVAANVQQYGTGAINVDGCRVATDPNVDDPRLGGKGEWHIKREQSGHTVSLPPASMGSSPLGRWPANVIHDGSEEVVGAFPESDSAAGDKARTTPKMGDNRKTLEGGPWTGTIVERGFGDSGSAARFFYTAKADSDDRIGSKHPTVKPVDLMQYLIRLVTPKVVLSCPQCHPWSDDDRAKKTSASEAVRRVRDDVPPTGQSAHGALLQSEVRLEGCGSEAGSVQMVWNGFPAEEGRREALLQQAVLMSAHGAPSGQSEAVPHHEEGLQADLDAAPPAREGAERLPVRTPLGNGANDRPLVAPERGGSPPEQRQDRQSPGELGTDAKGRSRQAKPSKTKHAELPALSGQNSHEPTCAHCGHRLEKRPGLVLDPFAGSGSTGEAAFREGCRALLIEREAQYFADIQRRMKLMTAGPDERQRESIKASGKVQDAGPLFA